MGYAVASVHLPSEEQILPLVPAIRREAIKYGASPSDAHDIAQKVLTRVIETLRDDALNGPAEVTAYAVRLARNAAIDLAARKRRPLSMGAEANPYERDPEIFMKELQAALADLPERMTSALVLHYLEGRSLDETAKQLDISPHSAGEYLTEAVRMLRNCMTQRSAALY